MRERLLVVADPRCSELVLRDEIEARLWGAAVVHLVVPVRDELEDAKESVLVSVGLLQQRGLPASGSVGMDDPFLAMADAVRRFRATRVLLAVPAAEETELERGLLTNVRALAALPVTQVVVPGARAVVAR